ncbi:ComF family protein [Peptoniphilus sp.]|jgi:competence protein ComFC|uniref:ComF family protein n=1 Tax=Peptoniphilus sp. TaxID=1971214 RepID=UPI003D8D0616
MKKYNYCINCEKKIYDKLICDDCMEFINKNPAFSYPIDGIEFLEIGATYSGLLKKILLRFKFNNKLSYEEILGDIMIEKLLKYNLDDYVITSVPMTKKREDKRGYNQARLLAKYIGRELDLEYVEVFEKIKETPFQVGLGESERKKNLENSFALKNYSENILITDDVITTGTTISELVKVARENGIKKVAAIVTATEIA